MRYVPVQLLELLWVLGTALGSTAAHQKEERKSLSILVRLHFILLIYYYLVCKKLLIPSDKYTGSVPPLGISPSSSMHQNAKPLGSRPESNKLLYATLSSSGVNNKFFSLSVHPLPNPTTNAVLLIFTTCEFVFVVLKLELLLKSTYQPSYNVGIHLIKYSL